MDLHTITRFFYLLVSILTASAGNVPTSSCRCLSYQNCWPSRSSWNQLNSTVNGRLIRVLPPAAPCHSTHFNYHSCQSAQQNWRNMFWRTNQPGAYQDSCWQPDGNQLCLIDSNTTTINSVCSQGLVPVLAVDAHQPSDVQSAVLFASKHNLRLVIKNTGHDYVGRSRAAGSFAVWTHNLRGLKFHDAFLPDTAGPGVQGVHAVTVGGGVQWEEVYLEATKRHYVVVGGGCSSVGAAGGYLLGGGHSALSPTHGLAADNALQLEVVTADGKLLVANQFENRDLFWALRGGGGGTFGVVVSVTYKLHPAFSSVISSGYMFSADNRVSFERLMTKLIALNPGMSDAGWGGYGLMRPLGLTVGYLMFDRNMSYAQDTFRPLLRFAEEEAGVDVQGGMSEYDSFQSWHLQAQCNGMENCYNVSESFSMDVPVSMASRLIPRKTFEEQPGRLAKALVSVALDFDVSSIILNLVGGGKVAEEQDNAVNPAWRRSLWHVVLSNSILETSTLSEEAAAAKLISDANGFLRRATPGSGSYMNEADYNEPDWQHAFFGDNYPRLLDIKDRYDPDGLFTCHHCVGSERWSSDLNCKTVHLSASM